MIEVAFNRYLSLWNVGNNIGTTIKGKGGKGKDRGGITVEKRKQVRQRVGGDMTNEEKARKEREA